MSIEQIWCAGHNTVFTKWKSIEQIWCAGHNTVFTKWKSIEQIWCAGHNTVLTMYMYTTQEYLAHHTRIYLPKWNQCPHQSGISVHTKVESVSTPNGISTPPECNGYIYHHQI